MHDSLKSERLMNERTLEGVIDKILHGEPFQESTFWDRVSILIRDIILEHPFTDGNKRVAFVVHTEFLYKNGYEWNASDENLINFTLEVASGKMTEIKSIGSWIEHYVQKSRIIP